MAKVLADSGKDDQKQAQIFRISAEIVVVLGDDGSYSTLTDRGRLNDHDCAADLIAHSAASE